MTWKYVPMFLAAVCVCVGASVQPGDFWTHCHDRHFWVTIKSTFLGEKFSFHFEDRSGFTFPPDRGAAQCGYTALRGPLGDLLFRASFLACHVQNQNDTEYSLNVWFVNSGANGTATTHPLRLHCALWWPWAAREIVCEENYMEVSVQIPKLQASVKVQPGAKVSELGVIIHGQEEEEEEGDEAGEERSMSWREASDLGYLVSQARSRLLLRAAYSSPLSFTIQERGVDIEVVRASILASVQGVHLAIDATVACSKNKATVDGSDLLWTDPHVYPPLVHGRLVEAGTRLGVGPLVLTRDEARERGYRIILGEGLLELRVPLASPGTDVKSAVVGGRYGQVAAVDQVFFMRQWQDDRWPLTQQRLFRPLGAPFTPRTLLITNNTVVSKGVFNFTLGGFLPDVSLHRVTLSGGGGGGGGVLWTLDRTPGDAQVVSRVSHGNGSHSYRLLVPFSHAGVTREHGAGGYRRFTLALTFDLIVSPRGEVFHHHATVQSSGQDLDEPGGLRLEAQCLERSLRVRLLYGPRDPDDLQWELYLGGRLLDLELVQMGGFSLDDQEDSFDVEIPLHGTGLVFQEVTLGGGVVVTAEMSVLDLQTQQVQDTVVHRCTFPAGELLVCLPEGRMVAVVDTTRASPPVQPNRTTLVDPSCVPVETDSARALFRFDVDTCGTTLTTNGDLLVYENQVRYQPEFLPRGEEAEPVIQRDTPYSLTLQCRYPANGTSVLLLPSPR